MTSLLSRFLITPFIILLKLWHLISRPLFGERCRFCPSCSEYACEALKEHGLLYGSYLSFRRVLRCNPWGPSGYDPVPKRESK